MVFSYKCVCRPAKTYVGFEVFAAVVMNVAIFWDIVPCSPYVK
jgi:hypothetical protein